MSRTSPRKLRRRGAGLYLATLMLSLLVTGTGATLISMQMSARHLQDNLDGADQSALVGQAGMEWALMTVQNDSEWRSNAEDGDYNQVTLDLAPYGSVEVTVTDPDGDFQDDDTDTATLTIASDVDGAVQAFDATLEPYPHQALSHAIHASNWVTTWPGVTILGPIHADAGVTDLGGLTTGDNASFSTLSGTGFLSPSLPNPEYVDSAEPAPTPNLAFYLDQATSLFDGGADFNLSNAALSSSFSTEGATNSEGIYLINAGGRRVKLRHVYVKGTLIITNTGGRDVIFEHACRFETGDQGYPILLVDCAPGDFIINMTHLLDEEAWGVDFNGNGDDEEVLSLGFFGLVWANANLITFKSNGVATTFRGSAIGSDFYLQDTVILDDDPGLATRLIPGFTDGMLHFQRGSMREIDP